MACVRRGGWAQWVGAAAGFLASAVSVALLTAAGSPAPAHLSELVSAPIRGFRIPNPLPLLDPAGIPRWAPVIRRSVVRSAPTDRGSVVGELATLTPEGTTNLVVADREKS